MGQSLGKPLFSMAFTSDTTLRPCSRIQAIGRNFSFGRAKEVLRSMQAAPDMGRNKLPMHPGAQNKIGTQ